MSLMTIFEYLDVWLMCMFPKTRGPSWMTRPKSVCLLGMDLMSLDTDFLIRLIGSLSVVEMSYSWRTIPLTMSTRRKK
ncbi:hypothetical protein U1Q18_001262, partial [Sarracenia purpurea var. burkii]